MVALGQHRLQFEVPEACKRKVELSDLQVSDFEGDVLEIPLSPAGGPVYKQSKRLDLRWCPVVTQDDGQFRQPELPGGLEPQVSVDELPVRADQHWYPEAEFPDRGHHPVYRVIIPAQIAPVRSNLIDRPHDCLDRFSCHFAPRFYNRSG